MPRLVTAEAVRVRWEPNSSRVHDVLDMSLARAVTGFAVGVMTRSRLMAMARVAVVRAEKIAGTLDPSRSVICLLVRLCHHPGTREEHEERTQGNCAPNDRPEGSTSPWSVFR
jgi:hypothetical protein